MLRLAGPRLTALAIFAGVACAQIQITPLFENLPGETSDPRWSPAGKSTAFTRFYSHYDTHLVIRDLASGKERDFGNICFYATRGVWSPDGKYLGAAVYRSESSGSPECRPALFSAASGARVLFFAPQGGSPAFSPDGRSVAYSSGQDLMLVRLDSAYRPVAAPVVLVHEQHQISSDVEWSADGKEILYSLPAGPRRISISPGAKPQDAPASGISITQYLPDGAALGTETVQNSVLWRVNLRSTPIKLEKAPDQECSPGILNCSPDGRHHAIVTTHDGNIQIAVTDADGSHERVIVPSVPLPELNDPGGPDIAGWSPDGQWIAFTIAPRNGNGDIRSFLYVVPAAGGAIRRLGKEALALNHPVWAPDSNLSTPGRSSTTKAAGANRRWCALTSPAAKSLRCLCQWRLPRGSAH